jgi:hypothetical protein
LLSHPPHRKRSERGRASGGEGVCLRAPFSLQKIHWNPKTKTVIYRSRRSWRTKRNFEVFKATDFLAAAIDHIPPRGQQTIRSYGLYSNKSRGMPLPSAALTEPAGQQHPAAKPPIVPPPPKVTARAMRPLWRDLILRVWEADPLQCPCWKSTMKVVDTFFRAGEIEFFLRLHGLWEGVIAIPPPPDPPFDIETFEPIEPPWQAIREWIPDDEEQPSLDLFDQRPDTTNAIEIPREDGTILVLDSD